MHASLCLANRTVVQAVHGFGKRSLLTIHSQAEPGNEITGGNGWGVIAAVTVE
jgi:hypothetical protein